MEARSGGFAKIGLAICVISMAACLVGAADKEIKVKTVRGEKVCDQGWECKGYSKYCCNLTISDIFQTYQFENLFSKRNTPVANAVGFWDYRSFILAASTFEHLGFGTTGGKLMQMKEIAAFLGHVGCKTSSIWGGAKLADVLKLVGIPNCSRVTPYGQKHVEFVSIDKCKEENGGPYKASIPLIQATNHESDVLLAYEMNGETLNRDHLSFCLCKDS